MKRFLIVLAVSITVLYASVSFMACAALQQAATAAANVLSEGDIGDGLRSALTIGSTQGSDLLSAKGGFFNSPYKILLPEEARQVTSKLQFIPGFGQVENLILQKINSGAESAAAKAKPIFIDAVKKLTITDALSILMGDKNSATQYLKTATNDQLYAAFLPTVQVSLDEFGARKYWSDAVNAYNRIPLVNKVNPSLDDYVTKQAMVGLFSEIEKKERAIRSDKSLRTTDLLQRVFAKQDGK